MEAKTMFGLSMGPIRLLDQSQMPRPPSRRSPPQQWSDGVSRREESAPSEITEKIVNSNNRIQRNPVEDAAYEEIPAEFVTVGSEKSDEEKSNSPHDSKMQENDDELLSRKIEKSIQENFTTLKGHLMENIAKFKLNNADSSTEQYRGSRDDSSGISAGNQSANENSEGDKSDIITMTETELSSESDAQHVDLEERWRAKLKSLLAQNPQFVAIHGRRNDNEKPSGLTPDNPNRRSFNNKTKKPKSKVSFDEALHKMLSSAPGSNKITYSHDHYDAYARTSQKGCSNGQPLSARLGAPDGSPLCQKTREEETKGQTKPTEYRQKKTGYHMLLDNNDLWGPEAKVSSSS